MVQSLLVTTSAEGLQPLGTAAQRSFEMVTAAIRARLSEEHAALFAEPVAAQHGDSIDWHAPREGRVQRLADLSAEEQAHVRARLAEKVSDVRAEAEKLAESSGPGDQRLAEALANALEIPGEDMVFALRDEEGALHPVLVHWAWLRDEQRAVRGVLSAMVARPAPQTVAMEAVAIRSSPALWWFLLLGWLVLAFLLAVILWLLIRPCGLWRTGPDFCPVAPAAIEAALTETRVAADETAALERELALLDRGCQPTIPVLPVVPESAPETTPMPAPESPAGPAPDRETDAGVGAQEREAAATLATERGVKSGPLTFLLEWTSAVDIDLAVACPAGPTVSRADAGDCEGTFALEADADQRSPMEAIVFDRAMPGLYKVTAKMRGPMGNADVPVILHMLRRDGPSQSYMGMLGPGQAEWTTNISISR